MQHVIFVKLAVFRKNWSREELCVTQQGVPADCQHHNWGRCSLYLGIQFSFDSLILYNLLFWFFNDHSRFWTDLIILGWFQHFGYLGLCFTDLTHFSQIEKFNEQFFAVCQTNWRGEELFVICQAAPAGCQHHNRGMWLFYLWIQFNYNSLIMYIVQFNSCKIGLISVRSNTIESNYFFEHCSWAL